MSDFVVISDSREQKNQHVLNYFESTNQKYFVSKMLVGDYTRTDTMSICIDKKKNIQEIEGNVIQQHARFIRELVRATEANIKLIILCEHGGSIKSMEDIKGWTNPRYKDYEKKIRQQYGIPKTADFKSELAELKSHGAKIQPPPTSGEQLYKMLTTISEKYEVGFEFCDKKNTGKKIIELLGGEKS